MEKMIITGASGFVGTALAKRFTASGYQVTGIGTSRSHPTLAANTGFTWISSDTTQPGTWQETIQQADVIINLTGRNIFHYWTEAYKQAIYDSRVLTTRHITDAMAENKAQLLLNASAVGIYGDCGETDLTESSPHGHGFLADVCRDWEAEALKAGDKGARVAVMRFGVVLGPGGGALSKMLPAFKLFAGGPLGGGRHWFPWIHIDDLANAASYLMAHDQLQGVFNFTGPEPVRQGRFAKALGRCLSRPSFMPAPAFMIRMVMGELGASLLQSQKASPENLLNAGFSFEFPTVDSALADILKK